MLYKIVIKENRVIIEFKSCKSRFKVIVVKELIFLVIFWLGLFNFKLIELLSL